MSTLFERLVKHHDYVTQAMPFMISNDLDGLRRLTNSLLSLPEPPTRPGEEEVDMEGIHPSIIMFLVKSDNYKIMDYLTRGLGLPLDEPSLLMMAEFAILAESKDTFNFIDSFPVDLSNASKERIILNMADSSVAHGSSDFLVWVLSSFKEDYLYHRAFRAGIVNNDYDMATNVIAAAPSTVINNGVKGAIKNNVGNLHLSIETLSRLIGSSDAIELTVQGEKPSLNSSGLNYG